MNIIIDYDIDFEKKEIVFELKKSILNRVWVEFKEFKKYKIELWDHVIWIIEKHVQNQLISYDITEHLIKIEKYYIFYWGIHDEEDDGYYVDGIEIWNENEKISYDMACFITHGIIDEKLN